MNNRGHRFGRRSLVIVFILGSLAGIAANRWLLPKPSSGGGNGPLAALAEPAAESVLDKRIPEVWLVDVPFDQATQQVAQLAGVPILIDTKSFAVSPLPLRVVIRLRN